MLSTSAHKPCMESELIIEVVYATVSKQYIRQVTVPTGATLYDAIVRSGLLSECPEIDLENQKVGIFNEHADLSTPLKAHDRVEIYRKLIHDPKESRRARAKANGHL